MKKVTAVFLSVLLILSLTACGQQNGNKPGKPDGSL